MSRPRQFVLGACALSLLGLAACAAPADPAVVARAVAGTLTAVPTQTPVVVVVTVLPPTAPSTPTAAATATAAPSPAAAPTEAPAAAAPAPTGAPAFVDDFAQSTGWMLGDDGMVRMALEAGRLVFTVRDPSQFRYLFDTRRRARDLYLELSGGVTAVCQPLDRYGMLFRVQDGANYYQFEVDCAGRYRLAKVVAGALTALRDWTPDPAIHAGAAMTNVLAVRARGQQLEAWVNAAPVAQVTDAAFAEGAVGFVVGSDPTSGFTAMFDDLRLWELR